MEAIRGVIRDYEWGDRTAIADLLGHRPPGHPEAEYWLGAHASAPSRLLRRDRALDEVIAEDGAAVVGPAVADRFSGLPFLLKILAAELPLSIQAHPSLAQAKAGFAREDEQGIERSARHRSYRDDNHKPELICALTPFDAKCGFRPVADTRRLLEVLAAPELADLGRQLDTPGPEADVLAGAIQWLLTQPTPDAAALADGATAAAAALMATGVVLEEFGTEVEWTVRIADAFPGDIGVVVALLLNHVSLQPGQAIFLQAGNLHSYLRGVGIELMANSDNVLRGGLTPKHIDVPELLQVVDYRPAKPPVQSPLGSVHTFDAPVPEFSLTRLDSTSDEFDEPRLVPVGPEIILVTSGRVALQSTSDRLELSAGQSAVISFDDGPYTILDLTPGSTVAWRATVGAEFSSS